MATAMDYLDAFRTSFVDGDTARLDSLSTDDFTFTDQVRGLTRSKSETLAWALSGSCLTIDDYRIVHEGEDCIAGTHTARGPDSHSHVFFFAKTSGDKVSEWHVTYVQSD